MAGTFLCLRGLERSRGATGNAGPVRFEGRGASRVAPRKRQAGAVCPVPKVGAAWDPPAYGPGSPRRQQVLPAGPALPTAAPSLLRKQNLQKC